MQFKKFLTIEHVPSITEFCSCVYVFGCELSLVRLCDSDFGITPVDGITIGMIVLPFASTQHIFHSSVLGTCFVCLLLFRRDYVYYYYYYYYYYRIYLVVLSPKPRRTAGYRFVPTCAAHH